MNTIWTDRLAGAALLTTCLATGFGSVEHFSRSYKALFGTSPGRARLVPG